MKRGKKTDAPPKKHQTDGPIYFQSITLSVI